jgi:precorrin-3B C17-methyltransferase
MQADEPQSASPNPRGWLRVVGLGPGDPAFLAPAARATLSEAEHIIGYRTYLQLAGPFRDDQQVQDSDNRVELERARHAFQLAAAGHRVVIVSSGDPGIFAMAAAVMEALEQAEDPAWGEVDLQVIPGISAAQAAAARIGAPLGHDFCTLSLSDNLKPWSVITRRLQLAAEADLVLALYNPSSRARPHQFSEALAVLRAYRTPETPVILGKAIGRDHEQLIVTTLAEVDPQQVDMSTVVIIGSSQTRLIEATEGRRWVYTPRWYPAAEAS